MKQAVFAAMEEDRKECFREEGKPLSPKYKDCSPNAFYAFCLSLINRDIAVIQNKICQKFCLSPYFTEFKRGGFPKKYRIVPGKPTEDVLEFYFARPPRLFDTEKQDFPLPLQKVLRDLAAFQHLNYVAYRLYKEKKIPLPTLVLDWTWDFSVAKNFPALTEPSCLFPPKRTRTGIRLNG